MSTRILSTTVRRGTSMEVTNRGSASVHHRRETNASMARQFCFSGSLKMGIAAHKPRIRSRVSAWTASI